MVGGDGKGICQDVLSNQQVKRITVTYFRDCQSAVQYIFGLRLNDSLPFNPNAKFFEVQWKIKLCRDDLFL